MAREIRDGIYWITDCDSKAGLKDKFEDDPPDWYDGQSEVHIPSHAYLVKGEKSLLFDTLSPRSGDKISNELNELLDGQSLDYLVPSHPEPPHAGNTMRLSNEFPDTTLVAPEWSQNPELYYLDEARQYGAGDTLDLGTKVVEFQKAIFPDVAMSFWLFERETRTLFTVDWLGMPHLGHECSDYIDDFDRLDLHNRFFHFHRTALFWLQYANIDKIAATIAQIEDKYSPTTLAPAHGNVIGHTEATVAQAMERMIPVTEEIINRGRSEQFEV